MHAEKTYRKEVPRYSIRFVKKMFPEENYHALEIPFAHGTVKTRQVPLGAALCKKIFRLGNASIPDQYNI